MTDEEKREEKLRKRRQRYQDNIAKHRKQDKEFYQRHKEKLQAKARDYYRQNPEKVKEIQKKYARNNIDKIKQYREANRGKQNQYGLEKYRNEYRYTKREEKLEKQKNYRTNNRDRISKYNQDHYSNNKRASSLRSKKTFNKYKEMIPNPKHGRWTDGEVKLLMTSDRTMIEIAVMLNRSYQSTIGKACALRKAGLIQ